MTLRTANYTEEQLRQFQSAVSIVRDTPRVVADEGGEGLVTVGGNVPAHVIEAVRLAKERDPEFNDLGLLPGMRRSRKLLIMRASLNG